MNHNLIISESIDINVNVSKVWNALTNPEIIKEYLFGSETVTDWKVGSEIAFQGEYNGHKYRDHGKILENIPNEKISYTYWSAFTGLEDKPENYSIVTYTLEKISESKTKFTWTQKGFANEEGFNHSKNGMKEFMEKIKAIVER